MVAVCAFPPTCAKLAVEQAFGIKFKATATGWYYKWAANGMLMRAVNPEMGKVDFGYNPLGRRTTKIVKNNIYHYFWAGNVVLHEWLETKEEVRIKFVTWIYEDGSFIPVAKLLDNENYSIVSDYLGTPTHAYSSDGSLAWEQELDIYGRPRKGDNEFIPFLYQGQYFDKETGLAYNRFRYYDPSIGSYISQDPIGIEGGDRIYSYVHDTNYWIDILGLWSGMNGASVEIAIGKGPGTIYHSGKGNHAEMTGLEDLVGKMKGQDVKITNITGHFPGKIDKPVGICVDCRTDMFRVLQRGGANSVTIPVTKSNKVIDTITIPKENFAKVRMELENIRKNVKGTRQRSDAAWDVLNKYKKHH